MTATIPQVLRLTDLDPDAFYTPEFLAPIIGFTNWEIRDYCRKSGINTRLAKNRIMLTVDNARNLIQWVKSSHEKPAEPEDDNPFK